MKISIPKDNRVGETKVEADQEVDKKFTEMGFDVNVERDEGKKTEIKDEILTEAGDKSGE